MKMGDLEVKLKYKKDESDDWTKVEDKALRKKIQNRLAKRKNRDDAKKNKRRMSPVTARISDASSILSSGVKSSASELAETNDVVQPSQLETQQFPIRQLAPSSSPSSSTTTENSDHLVLYPRTTTHPALATGLKEHHYLQLPHYSVLRAMVRNADVLGLDSFLFYDEEALSPYTAANPFILAASLTTLSSSMPHTLCPTPLQLATPHHPYLDVIAIPSFRDNIIIACLSDEQEEEVCKDLHTGSFTIWGSQPWNAMSWEASQTFIDKWWWLVGDETIVSSNFWRAERGEGPLNVPVLDLGEVAEEILK